MTEFECKEGEYQVGHESYNRVHTPCPEQPTKSSSEVKRISNPIIEPETGAENGQSVSQPLEQPKCKTCKDTGQIFRKFIPSSMGEDEVRPCPDCIERPNQELMIVKSIQGLISAVNRELGQLNNIIMDSKPNSSLTKKASMVSQALEEIDLFEKTTLFELQKAFE